MKQRKLNNKITKINSSQDISSAPLQKKIQVITRAFYIISHELEECSGNNNLIAQSKGYSFKPRKMQVFWTYKFSLYGNRIFGVQALD